jgi:hypothetical protein
VSYTVFLSLLMVTFACIGFVLAIVMGRLGHSTFAWGLLGLVLGPIALLLALVEVRSERPWWTRRVASGHPGSGPVDVLVGIDGSPESAAATTAALGLLGDRVGRLTLVAVTEVDDSTAATRSGRGCARSWSARPRRSEPGSRSSAEPSRPCGRSSLSSS